MTDRIIDWYFHEQTEEYQQCWRLHSDDGYNPVLDYNELIYTIVQLQSKIADLEARLDKEEAYRQEQNDT
jgi:hypothetical protein